MNHKEVEYLFIPTRIINKINSSPKVGGEYYIGIKQFAGEVLKVDKLIFQSNGTLKWTLPNTNEIIISADEIVINEPSSLSEICQMIFITKYGEGASKVHDGRPGINAPIVDIPPPKTGRAGFSGDHGQNAPEVPFFDMPTLYIFYKNIRYVGVENIHEGLYIHGKGLNGGNGGTGGNGASGSNGAVGESSSDSLLCESGPGEGGSGGNAGSGGKGGNAGRGGNGLNIQLLGPMNESQRLKVDQIGGVAGLPGLPGLDGFPGRKGDEGWRSPACFGHSLKSQMYPPPKDGVLIPNPNKGSGEPGVNGQDGQTFYAARDNNDILSFDENLTLATGITYDPENNSINSIFITQEERNGPLFTELIPFEYNEKLNNLDLFIMVSDGSFTSFTSTLKKISNSLVMKGFKEEETLFKFYLQRKISPWERFYSGHFYIIGKLELNGETITETFKSFVTVTKNIGTLNPQIKDFSKFVFNDEYYDIEKNIIGHRLSQYLSDLLKF